MKIETKAALFLLSLMSSLPASNAFAQDANAFQNNIAHDGIATSTAFATPLHKKWLRNFGSRVSYPLITEKMVFVTIGPFDGNNAELVALDIKTGATIWTRNLAAAEGENSAAYDNGLVFSVTADCLLQTFTADQYGTLVWKYQLPKKFYSCDSAPIANNGIVYVAGAGIGGRLFALREADGKTIWSRDVGTGDGSTPAMGQDGVYVTYPCQYYKFDPKDGHTLWHTRLGCIGGGGMTPVYYRNRLYVWDWMAGDSVLDSNTGKVLGPNSADFFPTFWKDGKGKYLELACYGNGLHALDLATGNELWTFYGYAKKDLPYYHVAIAPVAVNGYVVVGTTKGDTFVLDIATGKPIWEAHLNYHDPIILQYNPISALGVAYGLLVVPANTELVAYGD
jgi:outer membrane protein assembly factor BamB